MSQGGLVRRDVIRGLAAAVLLAVGALPARAESPGSPRPRDRETREARRRWALARMDEVAGERRRCAERFQSAQKIRDCQAECDRRYRVYNEVYVEALRD